MINMEFEKNYDSYNDRSSTVYDRSDGKELCWWRVPVWYITLNQRVIYFVRTISHCLSLAYVSAIWWWFSSFFQWGVLHFRFPFSLSRVILHCRLVKVVIHSLSAIENVIMLIHDRGGVVWLTFFCNATNLAFVSRKIQDQLCVHSKLKIS